ncbi:hypothetical protein [Limosilactobacillus albertensis]|uniref:Lipoprotein n=1 Tax=Limosilactobacillus albertensis TaxID=2759752 RepID=A0A839GXU0_9LACO|nr:hypothetical protein [Limosilactobacillus albertensis]MBB1123205.1 hypothetical protein [Limosilactobacillus albertensis]MCD7122891.1 hypothetical protein [Limosilactobacillus albertensis]
MIYKKVIPICLIALLAIGLSGCSENDSSLRKENSSLRAENNKLNKNNSKIIYSESDKKKNKLQSNSIESSTTINRTENSSENNTQSSNSGPIQSAQDAENLIEHSMHVDPGVYHAVPTAGGFIVSRNDIPGSAFVQNNGNITWNDGSTISYGEASAPTSN